MTGSVFKNIVDVGNGDAAGGNSTTVFPQGFCEAAASKRAVLNPHESSAPSQFLRLAQLPVSASAAAPFP